MDQKKFRCGLLVESPCGNVRRIKLKDGGGTRTLCVDHIDMDFDSIRDRLVSFFELESTDDDSYSLYDFQEHPLDLNRYSNFLEYQQKNGLMFNSTLLYLCIQNSEWIRINKNRNEVSRPVKAKTTQKRTASSIVDDDDDVIFIEERPPKRKITMPAIADLRISSPTSSSSIYSYEKESNDLVERVKSSMTRPNSCRAIIFHLYEQVCTISKQTSSTLDYMQNVIHRQIIPSDQHVLWNTLNNVDVTCGRLRLWTETNQEKLIEMSNFPVIIGTLLEFDRKVKALRTQWVEYMREIDQQECSAYASIPRFYRQESTIESRYFTFPQVAKRSRTKEQTFRKQKRQFSRYVLSALDDLMRISCRDRSIFLYDAAKSAASEIRSRLRNARSLIEGEQCAEMVRWRFLHALNDRHRFFAINEQQKRALNYINHLFQSFFHNIHQQASQANVEHCRGRAF